MSYGITPYSVNLKQIETPFGSHDNDLKEGILSQIQGAFETLDQEFGGTPMNKLADDFFSGNINHPEEAPKYWYLVEILCMGYGRKLANDEWYPARGSFQPWLAYNEFNMFGLNTNPSLPTPDDFPTVFIVRNDDLDKAYAVVYDELQKEIYSTRQTKQFHDWVEDANKDNWDLVLFYY